MPQNKILIFAAMIALTSYLVVPSAIAYSKKSAAANFINGFNEANEKKRIKRLVAEGKISPAEGEQLMIERDQIQANRKASREQAEATKQAALFSNIHNSGNQPNNLSGVHCTSRTDGLGNTYTDCR